MPDGIVNTELQVAAEQVLTRGTLTVGGFFARFRAAPAQPNDISTPTNKIINLSKGNETSGFSPARTYIPAARSVCAESFSYPVGRFYMDLEGNVFAGLIPIDTQGQFYTALDGYTCPSSSLIVARNLYAPVRIQSTQVLTTGEPLITATDILYEFKYDPGQIYVPASSVERLERQTIMNLNGNRVPFVGFGAYAGMTQEIKARIHYGFHPDPFEMYSLPLKNSYDQALRIHAAGFNADQEVCEILGILSIVRRISRAPYEATPLAEIASRFNLDCRHAVFAGFQGVLRDDDDIRQQVKGERECQRRMLNAPIERFTHHI